jgi:hypothetical protein
MITKITLEREEAHRLLLVATGSKIAHSDRTVRLTRSALKKSDDIVTIEHKPYHSNGQSAISYLETMVRNFVDYNSLDGKEEAKYTDLADEIEQQIEWRKQQDSDQSTPYRQSTP